MTNHEVTLGDKVSSRFTVIAGKLTNNPAKIAQGLAKRTNTTSASASNSNASTPIPTTPTSPTSSTLPQTNGTGSGYQTVQSNREGSCLNTCYIDPDSIPAPVEQRPRVITYKLRQLSPGYHGGKPRYTEEIGTLPVLLCRDQ